MESRLISCASKSITIIPNHYLTYMSYRKQIKDYISIIDEYTECLWRYLAMCVCVGVERFHNYTLYAFISDSFVECLLIHRTCIVVVWSVESVRFPSQDEYLSWA